MTSEIEFNTLTGETWEHDKEWSRDDAIEWSFIEGCWQAEAEAEERKLEQLREIIENSHQEKNNENNQ